MKTIDICPLGLRPVKSTDEDLDTLYPIAKSYLEIFDFHVRNIGKDGMKLALVSDCEGRVISMFEMYHDKAFKAACIRFAYNLWHKIVN